MQSKLETLTTGKPETKTGQEELPLTIRQKLEELKAALLAQNASYETILETLYEQTGKNPTYVYAMSDDEIHTMFLGLERYQNLTIEIAGKKKITKEQAALLDENSV